jgi:hypothetical protein
MTQAPPWQSSVQIQLPLDASQVQREALQAPLVMTQSCPAGQPV